MMKNKFSLFLVYFLLLSLTSCETLPKKFIRKKVKPEHIPSVVYVEKGPYQKKYSNEYYYKIHFTLWKTWQDEILLNLTGNSKKVARSADEAVSHLEQMSHYLKPEKQAELQPLLEEMKRVLARFESGSGSRSESDSMKSDLERLKRLIDNDFYYDKVKGDILPDAVEL